MLCESLERLKILEDIGGAAIIVGALVATYGVSQLAAGDGGAGGGVPAVATGDPSAAVANIEKITQKLEYLFGNATGSTHNIERSKELMNTLTRIGINDNAANRQYMMEQLAKAFDNRFVSGVLENGRYTIETVLYGPSGAAQMNSIWSEVGDLITVYLFNR